MGFGVLGDLFTGQSSSQEGFEATAAGLVLAAYTVRLNVMAGHSTGKGKGGLLSSTVAVTYMVSLTLLSWKPTALVQHTDRRPEATAW